MALYSPADLGFLLEFSSNVHFQVYFEADQFFFKKSKIFQLICHEVDLVGSLVIISFKF